MILLRCIDFQRSYAEFAADGTGISDAVLASIERSIGLARALALGEIRVLDSAGAARVFAVPPMIAPLRRDPRSEAASPHVLRPQGVVRDQGVEYSLRLAHSPQNLRPLSAYVALVLATHPNWSEPLLQVRLALYEILANVLEHGRPLRAATEVEVGLVLEPRRVRGWIRDECVRFDPAGWQSVPVPDLVAGRSVRGYGMHLVGSILGTLDHSFDGNGNCMTFGKEVSQ